MASWMVLDKINFTIAFFNGNSNAEYRVVFAHHHGALEIRTTSLAIKRDTQIGPAVCICDSIVKGIVAFTLLLPRNQKLQQHQNF